MSDSANPTAPKQSWSFPKTFWFANSAELFERAAFYGMFISLVRYLNTEIGFSDIEAGVVAACFSSLLYFFPTFMGIMADKIGFKQALLIAFGGLTVGYGLLGTFQMKSTAIIALTIIMLGGAIVKPVISGTVAKCSDSINRARAMSIFYMVVNIGSFSGKGLAGYLNQELGLRFINYYAACMAFAAFILVALFYRNVDTAGKGKTIGEALEGLVKVMFNIRFLCLIAIVSGFWAIQGQLYSSMPTYIERLLGKGYKPEWLANINPFVVVCLVVPITHLIRNFKPASAIGIGLFIIPLTALAVALAQVLEASYGNSISIVGFSIHPLILMVVIGIGLQGLAECFLSPKFLEFASKQAPPDEVGLYLGYSHLTTFGAWLFGFIISGFLLSAYCPDPKTFDEQTRHEWRLATDAQYQFTLDGSLAESLKDGDAVADALLAEFASHNLAIEESASIAANESGKEWTIETEAETYTITEEKLKLDDKEWIELLVSTETARPADQMPAVPKEYDRAPRVWFAFAGVGVIAFLALLVFRFVTGRIDAASETNVQAE